MGCPYIYIYGSIYVLYYYRSIDGSAIFVGLNLYRLNKIVPMDESSDLKKKQSSIIRDREKVETFPQNPGMQIRLNKLNKFNETLGQLAGAMMKETEDFSALDIQANSF